jgi:hypothetical protein
VWTTTEAYNTQKEHLPRLLECTVTSPSQAASRLLRAGHNREEVVAALLRQLHAFEHIDSNYHRYEIIKHLRARVEVVGAESESCSKEALRIGQQLESAVEQAIATMARDGVGMPEVTGQGDTEKGSKDYEVLFFNDSDDDADSDSGSFPSFVDDFASELPAYHLLLPLLERLTGDRDKAGRREALSELCRTFQPDDLLASPHWKEVRDAVIRALREPANAEDTQALQFLASLFEAASPEVQSAELYIALCSHIKDSFLAVPAGGHPVTMLRKVRLLNQFQLKLAEHWLYYPRHVISNIVMATLDVLTVGLAAGVGVGATLTPLHLLAIIDPTALWFRTWSRHVAARHLIVDELVRRANELGINVAAHLFTRSCLLHEQLSSMVAEASGTTVITNLPLATPLPSVSTARLFAILRAMLTSLLWPL